MRKGERGEEQSHCGEGEKIVGEKIMDRESKLTSVQWPEAATVGVKWITFQSCRSGCPRTYCTFRM